MTDTVTRPAPDTPPRIGAFDLTAHRIVGILGAIVDAHAINDPALEAVARDALAHYFATKAAL